MTQSDVPVTGGLRIVERDPASTRPTGDWCVRAAAGAPPLSVHERKADAVERATAELRATPHGGVLQVHRMDGSLQARRQVGGALTAFPYRVTPVAAQQPSVADAIAGIRQEKKRLDQQTETFLGVIWPILVALGGPAVAGLISPAVSDQRSVGGVFWSTLAWSFGIALFAWLWQSGALGTVFAAPQAGVAALCLLAGAYVAILVGRGFYGVVIPFGAYGSGPPGWLLPYAAAAMATFGPVGAVLGAISGWVTGTWAGRLVKAFTAA